MIHTRDINIRMIITVAKRLGDLKDFLSRTFGALLANADFRESIPGHLSPDRASQSRLPLLMRRLGEIGKSGI